MDNETPSEQPQPSTGRNAKIIVILIVILLLVVTLRRCQSLRDMTPEIIDPPLETATLIVPPDLPATPIHLPAIALPDERVDLLGILQVRDVSTFGDRLNALLRSIDPTADTTAWQTLLEQAGIDPARFRPGEHAALFAHKPAEAWLPPWFTGLLPLTAYEHADTSPLPRHFASFDRYTLFAAQPNDLDAVLMQRNAYHEIAQQPMDDGLSLTLDLRTIWDHYGSTAKLWFPIGRGMAGVQLLNHPMFTDQPETVETTSDLIGTLAQMLFDTLDAAQSLTMDMRLTHEYAHMDLTYAARPDTVMAAAFSSGPVLAPDLMSLLPETAGTIMIGQESVADWTIMQALYRRLMKPVPGSPQATTWQRDADADAPGQADPEKAQVALDALIVKMAECGQTTIATRLSTLPDADRPGAMATELVILSENPDAMMALIQGHLERAFETGFNADINRILGLTSSLHVETETAPLFDGPIQRFRVAIAPDPEVAGVMPAEVRATMAMTINYEVGRLGPYILVASQVSLHDLAQVIMKSAPTGRHPLFSTFEPGTTAVGRVHPAVVAAMIQKALPAPLRESLDMAELDASALPPIDFATYQQDGHLVKRIQVPLRLLTTLKTCSSHAKKAAHDVQLEHAID